ncbi:DJ-1/PfpI family protein [Chitinophaga sp. 212800010-3]|uniref:DJ-1/PfpI family protein n=1 Tax=unclassified Chitinophaga TaxID=2619133 RepID=UPI002E15216E
MKNRKLIYGTLAVTGLLVVWLFEACAPIREFMHWKPYEGAHHFSYPRPGFDPAKKTVVLVADNEGTEIFDLMAPYYLFHATGKANVYVVAEKKQPVIMRKGCFLLPHFSFAEFDSSGIRADVVVIPNLSAMDARHQSPVIIHWIQQHYTDSTVVLSVCDGALTAAATGIYDGKPLTTHASDYKAIRQQYSKPLWVNNTRITHSGNLFSTAGVSNATDGSLAVISALFGSATKAQVMEKIHFTPEQTAHQSIPVGFSHKLTIGRKVLFSKNKHIGVLLQNGANELELAAVLDTYNRTFPRSIESFVLTGNSITTGYGLVLLPTASLHQAHLNELHVLRPADMKGYAGDAEIVSYPQPGEQYIIDQCLHRIHEQYGKKYTAVVRLLLDYN